MFNFNFALYFFFRFRKSLKWSENTGADSKLSFIPKELLSKRMCFEIVFFHRKWHLASVAGLRVCTCAAIPFRCIAMYCHCFIFNKQLLQVVNNHFFMYHIKKPKRSRIKPLSKLISIVYNEKGQIRKLNFWKTKVDYIKFKKVKLHI